ncbi:MAG: HD domain-containing protein [Motiliproteus sp.]|nr:HD domain-containing protein [Motiliproteus sp.]MCW9053737.1 HD domain-containing protein [Motiliproteus sp.]
MSMSPEQTRKQLLTDPLVSSLSESEVDLIIQHGQQTEFSEHDIVVHEGDEGDGVFFVLSGEFSVSKNFAGVNKELGRLWPGQSFGEISLISDAPRTATVTARKTSLCLKLAKDRFDQLLADNGHFGLKISKLLTQRMIETERAANRQLIESYQALIFALSDLAESRDPETGAHLLRVQNYCRLLAILLASTERYRDQIDDRFIEDLYTASPLHDIGKVGIPDGVLLKPGALTDQEFAIMKSHTGLGAKTLKKVCSTLDSSTFRVAYNVIHEHHERWDGSGYPNGTAGEEISLEGRIMALADVYDALLSKRVYKPAFSYEKTKAIITEGRGQHFDPYITDLFLANIDQFEAIHQQYEDEDTGEMPFP